MSFHGFGLVEQSVILSNRFTSSIELYAGGADEPNPKEMNRKKFERVIDFVGRLAEIRAELCCTQMKLT